MRKEYVAPELEAIRFTLKNVILASIEEETVPEIIGGGGGESEIDIELGI